MIRVILRCGFGGFLETIDMATYNYFAINIRLKNDKSITEFLLGFVAVMTKSQYWQMDIGYAVIIEHTEKKQYVQ